VIFLIVVVGLIAAGGTAGATAADRWGDLSQQAQRLNMEGRLRELEECLVKALQVAETFEPTDVRLPQTMTQLGTAVWNLGRPAEAEQLYLRALRLWEHNGLGNHPDAAATLSCLAAIRRISGHYREAVLLHERALTITGKTFGTDSPESANARKDLAADHFYHGEYKKTVLLLDPEAEVWDRVSPLHRAAMLNILGLAQHGLRHDKEAELQLSNALRIRRGVLGPAHPKLAEASANLALVKASLGEFTQAEVLIQEALSIVVANFGPRHPLEAPLRRVYACVLRKTGRKKEAQLMEQRAVEIEQAWAGDAHRGSYWLTSENCTACGKNDQPGRGAAAQGLPGDSHLNLKCCVERVRVRSRPFHA